MLAIAAGWILVMLVAGGFVLDRTVSSIVADQFDVQLEERLLSMIANAELSPRGEVRFIRPMAEQRFLEPLSGLYWQVSRTGQTPYPSRSLWDRRLGVEPVGSDEMIFYDMRFGDEVLRVAQQDATLPGSDTVFQFQVAQNRAPLDAQLQRVRRAVTISLLVLGLVLISLAAIQGLYGLRPLRRVGREVAAVRAGKVSRVSTDFVPEVAPLMVEINELLDAAEQQAEAARRHAGNLAHALKTPMAVLANEAAVSEGDFADTVARQTAVMRRHVDHHLARARALGRRSALNMRSAVWPSLEAIRRTVERIYPDAVTIDLDGERELDFLGERQDLEEMLGNLIENAAKYGGGRVFVTVKEDGEGGLLIEVEDDGPGIPSERRETIFQRGARLDTDKPGTGLGLAIVKDVAEIYGGSVTLGESEDLGGLLVRLRLPRARQAAV
ncbi:histidine kinase [Pacificimonas flava]|uniref:histidine kinase n=2 Tax=Pacificimonas TaxID=1960290 RepID=A0A219B654_9SPHN|nr:MULTISPECIES: ATP-binding protein [Pacificimonas]MBZ6379093.1 sensor histidine kinase N-terminal domain-containing protein [Pacificimonas aurantium]OWV33674.1 histidine kinase [Pacificimonas flava]